MLPPEKAFLDGLLCPTFSSGCCLSARETNPVPGPLAKLGLV